MKHSFSMTAVFLLCMIISTMSYGQSVAHRDVPKGQVTGLEMAVEGSLKVIPGGRLRWFVTVYEIVQGRKLRPASGTSLKALTSFQRQKPVVEVATDARGRASIEFDVPDTIESSFNLLVEARSRSGIKRTFDVHVGIAARYRTEFFSDKTNVPPEGELQVWGRVIDLLTNEPVEGHNVLLSATTAPDHRRIGKAHEVKTNGQGVFHGKLVAPQYDRKFHVSAEPETLARVARTISTLQAKSPSLLVYADPIKTTVRPGTNVQVDIVVRTPEGQPVPGATLTGLSIPVSKTKKLKPVITDSKGRARVPWLVKSNAELADVQGTIQALREGIGIGKTTVSIRVVRDPVLVSWAVEGGAFVPGLSGRMYVRAFHPDGSPWKALSVQLRSKRLTPANTIGGVKTNVDGVAMLDAMTIANIRGDSSSSCHGPTVAAVTLILGTFQKEVCVPVDPDATMRVRTAPRLTPGKALHVEIVKVPAIAKAPVVVTVLRGSKRKWTPVAQQVVSAKSKSVDLVIPSHQRGTLLIRARPLIGAELREVRGGTAMVWATPELQGHELEVIPSSTGKIQMSSFSSPAKPQTGFAMALSMNEGARLVAELAKARGDSPPSNATDLRWSGFLASLTLVDNAVSSVLRGGTTTTLAMPEDSVALGLLRDPWRSQARFVRGRLGRLLFALESYVSSRVPGEMDDVAAKGPKGWRFNSEILTALADDIGRDAISGLDGSPLTIQDLQSFDRGIRFDNVARRLTRKRLLNVLVGLRKFVTSRQLDYQWAQRGDPKTWMTALLTWDDPEGELSIGSAQLFDGWGKPFAIRKARGGRARFRFLEPIVGYELISAGPDGTFGTKDDVFDPFARVLKKGSLYGDAVGEEALLARLHGVELGRATIAALQEVFDIERPYWESLKMTAHQSWKSPKRLLPADDIHMVHAVVPALESYSAFTELRSKKSHIDLTLSAVPRRYMVVAGSFGKNGSTAFDAKPISAGVPLLVKATMPPRLRPNEPIDVPLRIVGLGKHQNIQVSAAGEGAISVNVLGTSSFSLQEGEARQVNIRISATRVGSGTIRLIVKAADGTVIREYAKTLQVMWEGGLRAQHDGVYVEKRNKLAFQAPADAKPIRSFLVVSSPRDILKDPSFSVDLGSHPAILAWGYALRGEQIPDALAAALLRSGSPTGPMASLIKACAATAWSSMEEKRGYKKRRMESISELHSVNAPEFLRERSALLVALSSSASMFGDAGNRDPVTKLVSGLRNDGWHAPRTEKSRPTIMARLAAGLLLADPKDVPGREMFKLAREALVSGPRGGKLLRGEHGSAVDGWVGTLALAIAARQLGEDSVASELIEGVTPRLYLGMMGEKESAFWLIAASAYGVFGVESSKVVLVRVNGTKHRLTLDNGIAVLPLPDRGAKVTVESRLPVVARLESRYVRPIRKTTNAPLVATIAGDVGHSGGIATLEITVESISGETIARPVVEIALPSAASLSAAAMLSIVGTSGVIHVDTPDILGVVRVHLSPLGAKELVRLPLPIQWIGTGTVTGLSLTVYDATKPWSISSSPSRTIKLKPARTETWR